VAANALAVPITGFWVMPWAIVACVLMPLHLEAWALAPMSSGIAVIAAIARTVTAWPGAIVSVASMPAAWLAALGFGGAWLCIWQGHWRWLGLLPMAAAYGAIAFERPPDLFVAAEGNIVAVRAPDGAYLPSSAKELRAAGEAARRFGTTLGAAWPASGISADGALSCDAEACLYRARGRVVALMRDGAALAEDCTLSDLVVAPVAAHRLCRGARVIDRIDTWRKGGHEVWLDPDRIRIVTVRDWQGARPWVPRAKSARERAEEDAARLNSSE
jgi:competence protein ComEC